MTKKDYELIAKVLRSFLTVQLPQDNKDLTLDEYNAMRLAHNDIVRALAFEFEFTYPRFDSSKFLKASGITE